MRLNELSSLSTEAAIPRAVLPPYGGHLHTLSYPMCLTTMGEEETSSDQTQSSVFVRNLSFDTTKESLQTFMRQFGWVNSCLICVDKATGHPKGSAFVYFKKPESMEKCLACNDGSLFLDGRRIFIDRVIPKQNLDEQLKAKKEKKRDKRNLYLAREGFIHAESEAANGVSEMDLKKRLTLEMKKRKLLQCLTNYVSTTRLCIHNLPETIDDGKLKKLMLTAASDSSAKIIECRVMKNRLANGKFSKSKGFAFVEFTEHQHALKALRSLNNNPTIFTPQKRPIVEFAIEDKVALNKRKRRMEKSLAKKQESNTSNKKSKKVKKKDKTGNKEVNENKNEREEEEEGAPPASEKDGDEKKMKKKRKKKKSKGQSEDKQLKEKKKSSDLVGTIDASASNFTGIQAEPMKKKQAIKVPKVNRKIVESIKAVEAKSKQEKFVKKLEKLRTEQMERRKVKIARRREARAAKKCKTESLPEFDDYEVSFLKSTNAHV